jgi:hypothetical protein
VTADVKCVANALMGQKDHDNGGWDEQKTLNEEIRK